MSGHGRLVGRRLVGPALLLVAAPLLLLVIAALIFGVVEACYAIARGDDMRPSRFVFDTDWAAQTQIDWTAHTLSVVAIATSTSVVIGVGRRLGGRLPLLAAHRDGLASAGSAVIAPILVATGAALLWLGTSADILRARTIENSAGPDYLSATLVWLLSATAAGWWMVRHRMTWLRIVLVAVAVTGLAVTAAGLRSAQAAGLSMATAPAWFPLSLLSPDGWAPPDQALHPLTAVSSQLFDGSALALLCSCFVLAYGAGAADRAAKQPSPTTHRPLALDEKTTAG